MTRRLLAALFVVVSCAPASQAFAQLTHQGATTAASGHVSVVHGIAYAARHDVYLTVYEGPDGIRGRFVNSSGAPVGSVFSVAALGGQALAYANKPMVAYSTDTADDVFFVMYATDFGKSPDAVPSAWIQRVSFTGSGGQRVGNPILVGQGAWEIPNDLVFNPATRQFVAVWERFFSEGPDVMVRYFNVDGSPATDIINVSGANHGQGAAKAAVDWERNRILIAYQGLHPNSAANPETLGLWAKIVDGSNGALLTGLLTVQNGFTIEAMPVFLPEVDGFLVAWTGFNPGRDVQGRYVSSATGSVGAMPNPVYAIAASGRQEGAAMGMYDAASRRVLMAIQSSGACAGDTCAFLDGAILAHQGAVLSSFTGLSTASPSPTGGTFYPDVAVGEGGQLGLSYSLNYAAVFVERVSMPAVDPPGPSFGGGGGPPVVGVTASPNSLSFAVVKDGSTLSSVTPRAVSVSFSSSPGAWTATTTAPWLQITGASGTGNGQFSVTVVNPSNVIGSQTSLSGTVVLTAPGASNSPVSIPVSVTVSAPAPPPSGGQLSLQGTTALASGHVSVVQGSAYSPRHDVYLTVYEGPNGIRGRFVNTAGVPVGDVFAIATTPGQATSYANKPMVAYSHDTQDDVFFVMYASDYTKAADAQPSAWIQRVNFTGTGGARVGNPIQVGDGGWEVPNDLVYNPVTRQFVAVWERFLGPGPDVMVRFFNADGTPGIGVVNITAANHGQGAAKAAVDWERNRILIAYQGLHPNSAVNPETLGLWAKIVDGTTGALLTDLLATTGGFTIEAVPVFLPEVDGFVVAWTGFNPGRDVQARFVSSATASLGAMPNPVYTVAGSSRQEGAAMGMYDAVSRRVLMAIQSSGGCPNDTCPFLDGAILAGNGSPLSSFTGLSTAAPSSTGGSFYPDVTLGEGGQFGVSYTLNYFAVHLDRVMIGAAGTPGPVFGGTPSVTGVTLAPTSLSFAISKTGSQITAVTPAVVTVNFSSGTAGAWTATSSVPWLEVTGGTGSGNGQFSVKVINPSNVIGSQTSLSGNIVFTAPSAPNAPVTLPVSLAVSTVALQAALPFGQIDSPAQNASGLQGSLAITGWALDDTGVVSVQVYRNCLPFDVPQSCQTVQGHSVVLLGQAAFLSGARPDVEAAFPLYPNADRAGWGILILSNRLPHIPNSLTTGGQGPITFYAVATDSLGNSKLLGRSAAAGSPNVATPTNVTLANDSIAKPFGSIDTPALGATLTGSVPNFGWVLTPDDDAVAGNVDKVVPTDGSTITVFIDGVAVANVAYNYCRGTQGATLAPGVFCNDDIASIFGHATPRPTFTARSSNPTKYRNLDAGRGPIGAYVINTNALSNGIHTISWGVMDSAGRTEGIGSRFFTVANSAGDSRMATMSSLDQAPSVARGLASDWADLPVDRRGVWGRTGFDASIDWVEVSPDAKQERHVRLDEMGRLELWLGAPVEAAHLVANGTLRDLPIGSTLDGPLFSWAPGPAMFGTYQLAFLRGGERVDVFVTITAPVPVRDNEAAIRMSLEPVTAVGTTVEVKGTAFDPHAAIGSGIGAVHVWARNASAACRVSGAVDTTCLRFLGEASLDGTRFTLRASVPSGTWDVTAFAWNRRTARFEDARTATVTVR